MALRTLPLEMQLVIYGDTTFRKEFRWLPDGTTPMDFTGWSADMLIGPYHGPALFELSTDNGHITLTNDGFIRIVMSAANTQTLTTNDELAYQLDLTDPDGVVLRFVRGRMTVARDVERE